MPTTATYSGGNLFAIAAQQYGDFSAWWLIAQANNLTDPMLSGNGTLVIPDYSAALTGGLPPQQ
jgi:hypothetical protein